MAVNSSLFNLFNYLTRNNGRTKQSNYFGKPWR